MINGPCGFRPFDFYSKLKTENQKFTILIFNVWCLKNWKSQIYNLNRQINVLKIKNWKLKMVGWWFLFLVFKEKEN